MEEMDKKKRKRQKKLCKDIRTQMEFYFSDANLHKDRFLKQQINKSPDGWLKLELFSNFNKLKKLTSDLDLVAKALTSSQLIQVSDNGKKVRRKLPIAEPKDVDDRTVYVEFLPLDANHDWVRTTFSHYGKVVYVSLPKYKSSGDIKRFAFVEFETIKDAKRACEFMNNPPASESDQVGVFPVKGNKDVQRMQKILGTQRSQQNKRGRRTRTVSETEVTRRQAEDQEQSTTRKRTRLWSQGSGDADVDLSVKRLKTNDDKSCEDNSDSSSSDSSSSDDEPVSKKTKQDKAVPEGNKSLKRKQDECLDESPKKKVKIQIGSSDEEDDKEDPGEKKKRKKRKKKLKEDKKNIPELRVIPKKEWQGLRDEYIKLQKKNMSNLKTSLKELRGKDDKVLDKENSLKTEESVKHNEGEEKCLKKTNQLEFVAGVIVYLQSEGPLFRKNLKEDLGKFGDIKYIDVLEGDNSAHVRCANTEVATEVAKAPLEKTTATLLSGDEEKKYWDKILEDREKKLNSKAKPKKRGKDKAIGKVAQMREDVNKKSHIHFDEDP